MTLWIAMLRKVFWSNRGAIDVFDITTESVAYFKCIISCHFDLLTDKWNQPFLPRRSMIVSAGFWKSFFFSISNLSHPFSWDRAHHGARIVAHQPLTLSARFWAWCGCSQKAAACYRPVELPVRNFTSRFTRPSIWGEMFEIQSNVAISNSVNSKSPLFRSQADSPSFDPHLVLTQLFRNTAISNFFSCPVALRNTGVRLYPGGSTVSRQFDCIPAVRLYPGSSLLHWFPHRPQIWSAQGKEKDSYSSQPC